MSLSGCPRETAGAPERGPVDPERSALGPEWESDPAEPDDVAPDEAPSPAKYDRIPDDGGRDTEHESSNGTRGGLERAETMSVATERDLVAPVPVEGRHLDGFDPPFERFGSVVLGDRGAGRCSLLELVRVTPELSVPLAEPEAVEWPFESNVGARRDHLALATTARGELSSSLGPQRGRVGPARDAPRPLAGRVATQFFSQ